jgi:phosphoglycerate dehydrogenase-like enzyme
VTGRSEQRIGEADVLVISGLWRNDLLLRAKRLRFIQSIGAGTDQFSRDAQLPRFRKRSEVSASSK